jgi:FixJ family two-component response regulator
MMGGSVVAIVDDNTALLHSLTFLLGTEGYQVVAHASAGSFLNDRATQPACLIVDQQMPGMTGLELVAGLRKAGTRIPVLLMTGLPRGEMIARAAQLGIETVLEKPAEPAAILSFVNEHC